MSAHGEAVRSCSLWQGAMSGLALSVLSVDPSLGGIQRVTDFSKGPAWHCGYRGSLIRALPPPCAGPASGQTKKGSDSCWGWVVGIVSSRSELFGYVTLSK
jgi:hypothetical protein